MKHVIVKARAIASKILDEGFLFFSSNQLLELDRTTRRRTAFKSFADILNTHPDYRPSIYCDTDDRLQLANAYDSFMEAEGDERRAFRGGVQTPAKKKRKYIKVNDLQWAIVIRGESIRVAGKVDGVSYSWSFYINDEFPADGTWWRVRHVLEDAVVLKAVRGERAEDRSNIGFSHTEFNDLILRNM